MNKLAQLPYCSLGGPPGAGRIAEFRIRAHLLRRLFIRDSITVGRSIDLSGVYGRSAAGRPFAQYSCGDRTA